MGVEQVFADLVGKAGSRLLQLDPDAAERLRPLVGKVIEIELRGVGIRLFVCPHQAGLDLRRDWSGEVDVTLSGSPLAFGRALREQGVAPAGETRIDVVGDSEVAEQFSRLVAGTDIDWEESLSGAVGDYPARTLGNAARRFADWAQQARATLAADVGEHLQEERRLVAPRHRVERFMDDVDELRSAVERLAQRIERLGAHSS